MSEQTATKKSFTLYFRLKGKEITLKFDDKKQANRLARTIQDTYPAATVKVF